MHSAFRTPHSALQVSQSLTRIQTKRARARSQRPQSWTRENRRILSVTPRAESLNDSQIPALADRFPPPAAGPAGGRPGVAPFFPALLGRSTITDPLNPEIHRSASIPMAPYIMSAIPGATPSPTGGPGGSPFRIPVTGHRSPVDYEHDYDYDPRLRSDPDSNSQSAIRNPQFRPIVTRSGDFLQAPGRENFPPFLTRKGKVRMMGA